MKQTKEQETRPTSKRREPCRRATAFLYEEWTLEELKAQLEKL